MCELDIQAEATFPGEVCDLLELLGNLLDNAFKWSHHRVNLVVKSKHHPRQRRPSLWLSVEDDGPGVTDMLGRQILRRGVRGDERVSGNGIGLSIVQDIVDAYHGRVAIERSTALRGARFVVYFPFH